MDDKQLMERVAGGDEAALQVLLRRFGPLIRYILRHSAGRAGSGGVLRGHLPADMAERGGL